MENINEKIEQLFNNYFQLDIDNENTNESTVLQGKVKGEIPTQTPGKSVIKPDGTEIPNSIALDEYTGAWVKGNKLSIAIFNDVKDTQTTIELDLNAAKNLKKIL